MSKNLENCVSELIDRKLLSNICVRIGKAEQILLDYYKSTEQELNADTLFDMASVSKILSATQLALIAIDRGLLDLEDTVSRYMPDYQGEMTIRHLMTHTMGIGHKNLCREGNTYENIGEYILTIPSDIPAGSDVLYSCPGFILLGKILEKVYGERLDQLFDRYIAKPLGMIHTCYKPAAAENMVLACPDDPEKGIVHDYNCRFLGGIAGNAGIFSCVSDLDLFCHMLLRQGEPLYAKEIFAEAAQNHTSGMAESRGLGFVYNDAKYTRTGNLLPVGSVGHGGYTGQLVFADPKSGLYAIILTDLTRNWIAGRYDDYEMVRENLKNISNAIAQDLKSDL